VAKQGLTVRRLTGRAITPAHWERFHRFYLNTVDKRWGSAYLTRRFFEMCAWGVGVLGVWGA
jgi:uncharacterized protein